MDRDERVRVAGDDTLISAILALAVACCHHGEVPSVSRLEHVEKVLNVLDLPVREALTGDAHDVAGSKAGKATLSTGIRPMELRPCLLEEADPELPVTASRKDGLSSSVHRKVIVYDYRHLIAIDVEPYKVDTGLVDLLGVKEGLYAVRELGQRTQGCQEVAVAQLALVDVIGLNPTFKDVNRVEDLTGPLPLE